LYWRFLLESVGEEPTDEVPFETAVEVILAIAGSERADGLLQDRGPKVSSTEKVAHMLAWLLHDRNDVLEEAIRRAVNEGAESPARYSSERAVTTLLRARGLRTD
jgi:hypothetical protein